eukprot:CAMPEP_0170141854 /NCGR_PEP_ID=MMETSP0033_2-20121228/7267_1 /TAXON_ID=195969 /ORGANISM="Dolichomastix tenuilepis, Strain CCMP3274" /LENGTH=177 /DNA_ID=CAMNT_0010378145 /DNA_START=79 /DNA_END=608 /DNA_ORIENTATION=+
MGKKKGKKGKKKPAAPLPTFEYEPPEMAVMDPVYFVSVSVRMADLVHLNFEWPSVPTLITLAAIKDSIRQRHGGTVREVTLYLGMLHNDAKIHMSDDSTLADLGIEGALADGPIPSVIIFYDLPPLEMNCPIILSPPFAVDPKLVPARVTKREQEEQAAKQAQKTWKPRPRAQTMPA